MNTAIGRRRASNMQANTAKCWYANFKVGVY